MAPGRLILIRSLTDNRVVSYCKTQPCCLQPEPEKPKERIPFYRGLFKKKNNR